MGTLMQIGPAALPPVGQPPDIVSFWVLIVPPGPRKRQPTVSRSSCEAEYRALDAVAAELTWVSYILRDIGIAPSPSPSLFCDNISALYMSINPVLHARTKHVELDYHFVREKVAHGDLTTQYIPSRFQLPDIF